MAPSQYTQSRNTDADGEQTEIKRVEGEGDVGIKRFEEAVDGFRLARGCVEIREGCGSGWKSEMGRNVESEGL